MSDASSLHRESLVIDSHNDSAVALIRGGNLGLGGESGSQRRDRAGAVAYLRQYHTGDVTMQQDITTMAGSMLPSSPSTQHVHGAITCSTRWMRTAT